MTVPTTTRLSLAQALCEALETGGGAPVELLNDIPQAARALLWSRLYEAFEVMPGPEAGWRGDALTALADPAPGLPPFHPLTLSKFSHAGLARLTMLESHLAVEALLALRAAQALLPGGAGEAHLAQVRAHFTRLGQICQEWQQRAGAMLGLQLCIGRVRLARHSFSSVTAHLLWDKRSALTG